MSKRGFGWSLPPGVTTLPGENEWEESYPPNRCRHCQAWLRWESDKTRSWEDSWWCSGYPEETIWEYSESAIQILGESYRGKTYIETIAPCGLPYSHPSHKNITWAGTWEGRRCRNCNRYSVVSLG